MLVKILGAIDVTGGAILSLSILTEIPSQILIVLGLVLLVKSFMGFPKDFAGWIDFLVGITLILTAFITIPLFIKIIFIVLIMQKGISSFL
tara:strand:- start:110 stop:382 length:273 start_codon:yes stop_codon:yes gene_type:complete